MNDVPHITTEQIIPYSLDIFAIPHKGSRAYDMRYKSSIHNSKVADMKTLKWQIILCRDSIFHSEGGRGSTTGGILIRAIGFFVPQSFVNQRENSRMFSINSADWTTADLQLLGSRNSLVFLNLVLEILLGWKNNSIFYACTVYLHILRVSHCQISTQKKPRNIELKIIYIN